VTFTKVLTIYHGWIHPSIILLYLPFGDSFSRPHFSIYIHEYIIFPLYAHSYTILLYPPPSTGTNPQTGPVLFPYFQFLKNRHFCLLEIAIQGVSLWYFHVCMYHNLNEFIPCIFFLSTLVPFLLWFQKILKFYIHSCIGSTSTIFTFLNSFF
jgi:hypothetical protein